MNDDLGRLLQALHERIPDGKPDLPPVLRGGRKRRVARRLAASGVGLVIALTSIVAILQFLEEDIGSPDESTETASHEDGVFVPAEKGQPTYELYDIEILYPWAPIDSKGRSTDRRDAYCSTRGEWECGHRREQAGFSYRWRWSTNRYPGEVQCLVTLASADGSLVGRTTWQLSGLETEARRSHVVGVRVSERPVEARAECEAGAYASGQGVRVRFIRAESYSPTYVTGQSPLQDRIRVIFEAEALAEEHVDSRMCFMTLWFESGSKEVKKFSTNEGEGTWEFETGYPASDPVVDAKMRCRAIRASDS